LISSRIHRFNSPVKVQVQGGDQLEVAFKEDNGGFSDVRLTGPAEFVFEGTIKI
jgi:Diaminopimelate epimerase